MDEDRILRVDQAAELMGTQLSAGRLDNLGQLRRPSRASRTSLTSSGEAGTATPASPGRRRMTRSGCASVPERHLYRIPEAMQLLSMSRSVIYEQIRSGRLMTVNQGRSRLVLKVAITEYVNLLIRESEGAYYDKAS